MNPHAEKLNVATELIKAGVFAEAAINDPDGYDGGRTADAVNRIQSEINRLEAENARLREGLSKVATNLGNGSAAAPHASLPFLCDSVPEEVRLYCQHLRADSLTREQVKPLVNALRRMLHEVDELSITASDHIQPDEDNKPTCTCCGMALESASKGHKHDCMAQGVLNLWHATAQGRTAITLAKELGIDTPNPTA